MDELTQLSPKTMELTERIPPQNVELEKSVLGSCLVNVTVLEQAVTMLKGEDFYSRQNRIIFDAICELHSREGVCDLMLLHSELGDRLNNIGGEVYLSELISTVATVTDIRNYVKILKQRTFARSGINFSSKIQALCFNQENYHDLPAMISNEIDSLLENSMGSKGGLKHISKLMRDAVAEFEMAISPDGGGYKTGIADIDRNMGGLYPGEYNIIAGRPGAGKSSMAWTIAYNMAMQGIEVGIYTIEMTDTKVTNKFISLHSKTKERIVTGSHLRGREPVSSSVLNAYMESAEDISNLPIWMDGTASITAKDVDLGIRAFIRKKKLKVVIIDQITLMKSHGNRQKRNEQLAETSNVLMQVFKETNVCGIPLVQMKRESTGRRPILSDLRECGNFEEDAHNVFMLYNPIPDDKRRAYLCPEKARDGGNDEDFPLSFNAMNLEFASMDHESAAEFKRDVEGSKSTNKKKQPWQESGTF